VKQRSQENILRSFTKYEADSTLVMDEYDKTEEEVEELLELYWKL